MAETAAEALERALRDERSKRTVFISHCLLNENARYSVARFDWHTRWRYNRLAKRVVSDVKDYVHHG